MRATTRTLVRYGERYLKQHGVPSPLWDAEQLLVHVLGARTRAALFTGDVTVVPRYRRQAFFDVLRMRGTRRPLQYIVGDVDFMDCTLAVREGVLIPRPETEQLVACVLARIDRGRHYDILDAGTGTGAIAISLARACPRAQVVAVDCMPAACALARDNARRNGVEKRVTVIESNWYHSLSTQRFDLIVSNPPYVVHSALATLEPELHAEPREALDGGCDGADAYRVLIAGAAERLNEHGWIAFEVGHGQGTQVATLLAEAGFVDIHRNHDDAGRERIVIAQIKKQ